MESETKKRKSLRNYPNKIGDMMEKRLTESILARIDRLEVKTLTSCENTKRNSKPKADNYNLQEEVNKSMVNKMNALAEKVEHLEQSNDDKTRRIVELENAMNRTKKRKYIRKEIVSHYFVWFLTRGYSFFFFGTYADIIEFT
jgi:hypothetical protein